MTLPGAAVAGGAALLVVLVGRWALSVVRGSRTPGIGAVRDAAGVPSCDDVRFRRVLERVTGCPLVSGNRVEILADGDGTYPRLFGDLASAARSITFQVYFVRPGRMADRLAEILADRARAGVRVLFLYDALGAHPLGREYLDALREEGVEAVPFGPLRWRTLSRARFRAHSRIVVVDGEVGYTGGFGIDDSWYGGGRAPGEWRDTNVRITGPAVGRLQGTFAALWAESTGELLAGPPFFPEESLSPTGDHTVGVLHSPPAARSIVGSSVAGRYLALAVESARERLLLANAYFVPNRELRHLLADAAGRGVDVRILTASRRTDILPALYAGRAHYGELLEAGIRIWEYAPAMMHAKTMVVDGCFSAVGTLNLDSRSMVHNHESVAMVVDRRVASSLASLFEADLEHAREIEPERWRRRGPVERGLERGASVLLGVP